MRKHDLITISSIVLAGAGAGLFFYSDYKLAAQIIFLVAFTIAFMHTKACGRSFEAWTALLIGACAGGIWGDWYLSPAIACTYLSVNLRAFIFRKAIYSKALWLDPFLAVVGFLTYLSVNIFHHNNWVAWTFPVPGILVSFFVSSTGYIDRIRVEEKLKMGIMETGTAAPDFTLENFDGKKITLSDYKDKRDLLLIFVRGDWCPGCHIMLRLYERERKKFQDKNIMLMAIGPDPVGVNRAMVEKLGVEFAVLSDDKCEVSRKFCVRIQEDSPVAKFDPGIPLPASFLVDKKGIIRYTSRADNAGEFLSPDIIFDVLAKI